MTNSFWQTIAETPWWVYAAFIFLFYFSFSATKPRIVSLKAMTVFPLFFITTSILSICLVLPFSWLSLLEWLGTAIVGISIGWMQFKLLRIKAIPNEMKFAVPGSWILLIAAALIFCFKLYFGVNWQIDVSQLTQPENSKWIVPLYGLMTGVLIGRLSYARRCAKVGPFV